MILKVQYVQQIKFNLKVVKPIVVYNMEKFLYAF